MELTGKLKEDVAKCKTREEAKGKIEEAGVLLNDEELDSVAGGTGFLRREMRSNDSSLGHGMAERKEFL